MIRYVCTNCQHRFEAEEKEGLECPRCLWSTSVEKETDLPAQPHTGGKVASSVPKPSFSEILPAAASLWPRIRPWIFAAAAGFLFFFLAKTFLPLSGEFLRKISASGKISGSESGVEKKKSPSVPQAVPAGGALLSAEEGAVLMRRIEVTADREATAEEKSILENFVPFKTGVIEKLPSQAWTLENFKQMVAEQEAFYKIPLPGSYKGKLEDLLQSKYLPAVEAFRSGDILKARNFWVDSLAFPVYGEDIRKHRGVVLTMLRPFINDTLSKIGAINSSLVEQKIREQEARVSRQYQEFYALTGSQSWKEVLAVVGELEQGFEVLERSQSAVPASPAYPASFQQVDQDIQAALHDLLSPTPPSVADLAPLKRDVDLKRRVIESFIEENLRGVRMRYEEALKAIQDKRWEEAEKRLREIEYPLALAEDAREKVKILKKLGQARS